MDMVVKGVGVVWGSGIGVEVRGFEAERLG
jgi:hypothetical protein